MIQTIFNNVLPNCHFFIPSGLNHEMEEFEKLNIGRAKSVNQGRIEIFETDSVVWIEL